MRGAAIVQLHPQMTYLSRILDHISKHRRITTVYLLAEYVPLQSLNFHFLDYLMSSGVLEEWSKRNEVEILAAPDLSHLRNGSGPKRRH